MKIISIIHHLTFLGFTYFKGAGCFPDCRDGMVNVLFSTGIVSGGTVRPLSMTEIPLWMQYPPLEFKLQMAFIRHRSRQHFEVTFIKSFRGQGDINLEVTTNMPRYAEMKFTGERRLAARNFEPYRRSRFQPKSYKKANNFPTKNMIYVLMPNGDIYRSKLESWNSLIDSSI